MIRMRSAARSQCTTNSALGAGPRASVLKRRSACPGFSIVSVLILESNDRVGEILARLAQIIPGLPWVPLDIQFPLVCTIGAYIKVAKVNGI